MFKTMLGISVVLGMVGCQADRCRDAAEAPTVVQVLPEGANAPGFAHAATRTITVGGTAEILTAPDRFTISAGFEVQTTDLEEARDESTRRAAALLAVADRHGVAACDVQTEQLSLHPRYDNNYGEHRRLIGYEASRSLTLTLHDIDEVEAVLYDLAAAGANRIERVEFSTSALQAKRAEARVLAVEAAREKAEAMAAALGQSLGEPLRIDESGEASPWQAPVANYMLHNETVAQLSETVASGKVQVRAGVSVVFTLRQG